MKEIKTILFTSSLFALLLLAFSFNQFNLIFISFIFLIFISCFLKKKSLSIFLLSFSTSLIYFVVYTFFSYYETNSLFLSGGDDEFFYTISKTVYENGFDLNIIVQEGKYLFSANYKGYLLFNYLIIKLLNLFPYYELDILSFRLIKYLVSSLIPVLVYNIFKKSIFKLTNKGILLLVMFPQVIYFNYSLVRESYISLIFGALLYVIIYYKNFILKYLFALVLIIIAFSFREISGFFLLVFFLLFEFKVYFKNIFLSSVIVILIPLLSFWLLSQTSIGIRLITVRDIYIELSIAESSSSLGLSLLLSDNPLMFPFKIIYILLSPIPPAFIYNFSMTNFIKLIGNLSWYFVTFGCFVYYYKNNKIQEKISTPMILCLMFLLVMIVNTSMDPRHFAFMYPFLFPIGIYGLKLLPQSNKLLYYIILLFIGLSLYMILKIT